MSVHHRTSSPCMACTYQCNASCDPKQSIPSALNGVCALYALLASIVSPADTFLVPDHIQLNRRAYGLQAKHGAEHELQYLSVQAPTGLASAVVREDCVKVVGSNGGCNFIRW